MFDPDQRERTHVLEVIKRYGWHSAESKASFEVLENADAIRVRRLLAIVHETGWPLRSVVGERAATAAFTILLHADVRVQEELAPLIHEAESRGEVRAEDAAFLSDTIAANTGACQRYGTQIIQSDEGKEVFYPICDVERIDELRRNAGLEPIEEYAKTFAIDPASIRGNQR